MKCKDDTKSLKEDVARLRNDIKWYGNQLISTGTIGPSGWFVGAWDDAEDGASSTTGVSNQANASHTSKDTESEKDDMNVN